jgi:diguanylate cyclase (GGDEF)-like protein/PAS domain S-box-containing protein
MHIIQRLQELTTARLWLLSIFVSVVATGIIVSGMELLLKGTVTYDYLLTGFVASLFVSALVVAILAFALSQQKQAIQRVEEQSVALSEKHDRLSREFRFMDDILNSLSGIFYMLDEQGRLVRWNTEFEKVTGYTASELAQRHALDFFEGMDRVLIAERMREVFEQGASSAEAEFIIRDGGKIPYYFSGRRTVIDGKTHMVGLGIDVSERSRMEEMLREHEAKLRSVFEGSSDAIMLLTEHGFFDCNVRTLEMFGMGSKQEFIACHFSDISPRIQPDGRDSQIMANEHIKLAFEHGLNRFEWLHRRNNGEVFPAEVQLSAFEYGRERVLQATVRDITERKQAEERMHYLAHYDTLTNLPNRVLFMDRLDQEIRKANRSGLALTLLYVDLDQFKEVNDTLGHYVGDALLVEAARRIVSCVRNSDTVARLGGDEFTVILPGVADASRVGRVAQIIITALTEPFQVGGETVYISASIGVTAYPSDAADAESLLKNADQAMYVAKSGGRNRYSYFSSALQEKALARSQLVKDLRGALAAGQFLVYFQPIVEFATGKVRKAEGLIRWQHPERGLVSPVEFIPLAEETGLINEIGDWVFQEAVRWVERWNEFCPDGFQVSVNKSPAQFLSEIHHDDWVVHLRELGLPGRCVTIEITEGLLLNAASGVTSKLLRFRDAGIQVAIDDFGTGYSALSYLKKFDIDYLKIDQSFVCNMASDRSDLALCEAIIVMAHKLGLKVIAEGVETAEQRDLLAAAGCDYGQGYLFSRPVPPGEFEAMLKAEQSALA